MITNNSTVKEPIAYVQHGQQQHHSLGDEIQETQNPFEGGMERKKKAALYLRSNVTGDKALLKLQMQEDMCINKCLQEDIEIVTIIREVGPHYGKSLEKRTQLQMLFKLALTGDIQVVVCTEPSRLTRDLGHAAVILKVLVEDAGCDIVYAGGAPIDEFGTNFIRDLLNDSKAIVSFRSRFGKIIKQKKY